MEISGVEILRFAVGTVVRGVLWVALGLGALPISAVVAVMLTAALTGWTQPDPDVIVQGCETDITCAEAPTFWLVLASCLCAYVALGVLLAIAHSRRSRRQRLLNTGDAAEPA